MMYKMIPLLLATILCGQSATAQQANSASACIAVEVDGVRTLAYDCLTQNLVGTTNNHDSKQANAPTVSEQIVNRRGNAVGLFNQSATSIRLGNAFGNSITPQRPMATQITSPLTNRR